MRSHERWRSLLRRMAIAACAVAVAAGCGDPSIQNAARPEPVAEALRFEAPVLGGGTLDGSTLSGRAVLLWFWAPT